MLTCIIYVMRVHLLFFLRWHNWYMYRWKEDAILECRIKQKDLCHTPSFYVILLPFLVRINRKKVLRSIFACRLLGWAQRLRSMIDRVGNHTTVSRCQKCAVIYGKFRCGCLRCHLLHRKFLGNRGLAPYRTFSLCMHNEHQQIFT